MKKFTLVLCCFLGCLALDAQLAFGNSVLESADVAEQSEQNIRFFLRDVWPHLKAEGVGVLAYYEGVCSRAGYVGFPSVATSPYDRRITGVAAMEHILGNKSGVTVLVGRVPKTELVRIGPIEDNILRTKISSIKLSPRGRYNADLAIGAIFASKEMKSAVAASGEVSMPRVSNTLIVQPGAGRPHLPELLEDVSLEQALELVASTFGGVVFYGRCAGYFDARLVGGVYFDGSWLQ